MSNSSFIELCFRQLECPGITCTHLSLSVQRSAAVHLVQALRLCFPPLCSGLRALTVVLHLSRRVAAPSRSGSRFPPVLTVGSTGAP